MNLGELTTIAYYSVNLPWGLGNQFLKNSESQPPYYRFLSLAVREYRPANVLECGVYMATASVHMAIGNATTRVIGIDTNPHSRAYTAALLHNNIHLILGNTTDKRVFQEVKELIGDVGIGLLFLDSEHDGHTAQSEYDMWKDLFADECLVACDDILDPRMLRFWRDLPGEKMEINFLHPAQYPGFADPGFGISIVRKYGTDN